MTKKQKEFLKKIDDFSYFAKQCFIYSEEINLTKSKTDIDFLLSELERYQDFLNATLVCIHTFMYENGLILDKYVKIAK